MSTWYRTPAEADLIDEDIDKETTERIKKPRKARRDFKKHAMELLKKMKNQK